MPVLEAIATAAGKTAEIVAEGVKTAATAVAEGAKTVAEGIKEVTAEEAKEAAKNTVESIKNSGDAVLSKLDDIKNMTPEQLSEKVNKALEENEAENSAEDGSMVSEVKQNVYSDLDSMKKDLGKTYGEIKEVKPPNSPNIAKWFDNGGSIRIEEVDGKQVWTYIDNAGREVPYIDGYPQFPPEAKHPVIGDINIGEFTGDRNEDKKLYLQKLEEQYGLTEIPDGYALHHDSKNGNMQLVKTDWHKEFTHAGGHSLFKEGKNENI